MLELLGPLLVFLLSAAVIVAAGTFLASSADVIAVRMGWGHLWVGSLLLAGATSMPELAIAVASALGGYPELAAGDVLGANMINMVIFGVLLALLGGARVYQRLAPTHWFVAVWAIGLTALATLGAAFKLEIPGLAGNLPALVILGLYLVHHRLLRRFGARSMTGGPTETFHSLRWGWSVFVLAAAAVMAAGPLLAISAHQVAELTGMASGFIGVAALALVTTLPEIVTTSAALRMGYYDLAVAGLYGSNSFNIAILGVMDLAYLPGAVFSRLDYGHVAAGVFAILLMGLGLLQLQLRRPQKLISLTQPSPPLFLLLYLAGLFAVFKLS